MATKIVMVIAEKNGQIREFGPLQWKRMRELKDGTHDGWRELPSDTPIGTAPTFFPPEIQLPPVDESPASPDPGIQQTQDEINSFSDINGPGNQASPPPPGIPGEKGIDPKSKNKKSETKPGSKASSKKSEK